MKTYLKRDITNYIFVFILIALSGFPFFTSNLLFKPILLLSCLWALLIFTQRKKKWNYFILKYLLAFFIITAGQLIIFSVFPVITVLGYTLRIFLAFCVIKIIGKFFVDYYIKIIYFFSVISFFFFFSTLIYNDFERFFTSYITPFFDLPQDASSFYGLSPNILIFNFNSTLDRPGSVLIRNSGPFWEPGAFAGFTIVALIFSIIKTNKLFNRTNMVFMLAIITTFSTAGYVAFFLLVVSYSIQNVKSSYKYFIFPAIIIGSFYSYYNLEFLNSKINNDIETVDASNTSNRFVSALTDIEDIKKYWLFGRGFNEETRFDKSAGAGLDRHRNNGITALLVNTGVIVSFLYFFLIFKFLKRFCMLNDVNKYFAYSSLMVILTFGFAEGYFNRILFIALTMLFFVFKEKIPLTKKL